MAGRGVVPLRASSESITIPRCGLGHSVACYGCTLRACFGGTDRAVRPVAVRNLHELQYFSMGVLVCRLGTAVAGLAREVWERGPSILRWELLSRRASSQSKYLYTPYAVTQPPPKVHLTPHTFLVPWRPPCSDFVAEPLRPSPWRRILPSSMFSTSPLQPRNSRARSCLKHRWPR